MGDGSINGPGRVDNLGIRLAAIGIFGTPAVMVVHLIDWFAGWWGHDHVTWYVPLFGFVLVAAGNAIDTHRGKIKSCQRVDDAE